jgi:hypothetical protein
MASLEVIEVKPINIKFTTINIVGDTPLIVHAWSEKVKKEMLDKQMKKAKTARGAKDPQEEYRSAFYYLPDGRYGFPAVGFKTAAVSAGGRFSEGLKMTELRGAFFVDGVDGTDLVAIEGEPTMREDMVRVGMGTADIRYRPEFRTWAASLRVRFNADKISIEQLVNLMNLAGFGVGIGEWRPERDGQFGCFHVELNAVPA